MNKKFERFMKSIDDRYLEEAALPPKKKAGYRLPVLVAAACLVLAATGLLFRHTLFPADASPSASELAELGYTFPLPEDATAVNYALISGETENGPSVAQASFTANGHSYTLKASQTEASTDLSNQEASQTAPLLWNAGSLNFRLCSTSDVVWVDWYDNSNQTQWCLLSDGDTLALLTTANALVEQLGYNVAVAPENASDITYQAFLLNDLTVAETTFLLDTIRYSYRMAATYEIAFPFADISGTGTDYASHITTEVGWCPAELYFTEGGAGKIIWFDIVPGLLYSLSMETGASEEALLSLAHELFVPAQDAAD